MNVEILIGFGGLILTLLGLIFTLTSTQRENAREMKDFHGRLCVLEERYILMMKEYEEKRTQMMQKYLDEKLGK